MNRLSPPGGKDLSDADHDEIRNVFRAIMTPTGRHGIRLEGIFWRVLDRIAKQRGQKLSHLVADIENHESARRNLSSGLRVLSARHLDAENEILKEQVSTNRLRSLVYASPTPTLVLASNRKLISFNEPFLDLIRQRLLPTITTAMLTDLRLALDVSIETIVARLVETKNQPQKINIVLGINDRRVRSNATAILAPSLTPENIICFIGP